MKKDIFLAHSSKDKVFVRKLAKSLQEEGYSVWVDEAEIRLGDSLIEKISLGLSRANYIGAVISRDSIKSNWVRKELSIAMTREVEGEKAKVFVIKRDGCELPPYLQDKLFCDMRYSYMYRSGLDKIKSRLGMPAATYTNIIPSQEAAIILKRLKRLKRRSLLPRDLKLKISKGSLKFKRKRRSRELLESIEKDRKYVPQFVEEDEKYSYCCVDHSVSVRDVLDELRCNRYGLLRLMIATCPKEMQVRFYFLLNAIENRLRKIAG